MRPIFCGKGSREGEIMPGNILEIKGCPRQEGGLCADRCGGGWAGTKTSTDKLTQAILLYNLDPNKLGCQPLIDRIKAAYNQLYNNTTGLKIIREKEADDSEIFRVKRRSPSSILFHELQKIKQSGFPSDKQLAKDGAEIVSWGMNNKFAYEPTPIPSTGVIFESGK
jgi:hypothetical protein